MVSSKWLRPWHIRSTPGNIWPSRPAPEPVSPSPTWCRRCAMPWTPGTRWWCRLRPSPCNASSSTAISRAPQKRSPNPSAAHRSSPSSRAEETICASTRSMPEPSRNPTGNSSTLSPHLGWDARSPESANGRRTPIPVTATTSSPAYRTGPGDRSASARESAWEQPIARTGPTALPRRRRRRQARPISL